MKKEILSAAIAIAASLIFDPDTPIQYILTVLAGVFVYATCICIIHDKKKNLEIVNTDRTGINIDPVPVIAADESESEKEI